MENKLILTSESVGRGHPDKICDQIADKILDECLKKDKDCRVACEVFADNHLIIIGGQITINGYIDVVKIAWEILLKIGYSENDFTIISNISSQSIDIAKQVSKKNNEIGAGDQGIVFGYATNETKEYLPLSYVISNEIIKQLDKLISTKLNYCKYDMKSQISLHYINGKPIVKNVIVAIQHNKNVNLLKLRNDVKKYAIIPILKKYKLNTNCNYFINKNGEFTIGGPFGDTGLTGRKIIVDTYGSIAHHGGGAFSGKDPSKVDRTGAYYARYIAKNIIAANLADKCEVQLSFCIGEKQPLSMYIDCFNTNKVSMQKIYNIINKIFNFDIYNIIKKLDLKHQSFFKTSLFGHFGKKDFSWEKIDMVKLIRRELDGESRINK